MAWTELKTSIANVIKANGNQEITGAVLQSVLFSMIENLGWKYTYYGTVQISSEAPENTDGNIFVFPTQKGVYPNFGGLEVSNKLCIFYNSGANWIKQDLPALFYDNAIFTLLALNAATKAYGYYINLNGSSISDVNYNTTEYLSIAPEEDILYMGGTHKSAAALSFYNENKVFISATNFEETTTLGFKIEISKAPSNAKYVRATYRVNEDFSIAPRNYISSTKHIALTVANSISDFKGAADINGDGVSIYRNVGSKAIWNTTHKYAVIDFGASLNSTLPIMSIMFYDFENKTCGNLHIGFYTAGTEFSNVVYDHLSPYIESVKYEGHKLLITFTNSCKHRIISVNEIATPNRQGNITSGETSFYASLPDGEWKDAKEVLQSGILQNNLYDQANNVGYINTNGTSISVDDNWRYTDYISVSPGQTIDCILQGHTNISSVTFYNASREVLQTNIASINGEKIERTFTAPANSAFVRICGGNPGWIYQTYKQYANTAMNIWDEINALKKLIGTSTSFGVLSPYAIYTTCNDVIPSQKGRNRNYSQAVYLDHLFNGLTKELNIRFKDNIDRIVFNAPMVVTDSNETSPAVTFNGGENIHEEEVTMYVHGEDIIETPVVIKHRSTLNSITSNVHPKVLCIGDSITYAEQANIPDDNYTQNYAYHLICKELFMKDKIDNGNIGYDITFLGIYKKQKTFTYKEEEHTVITHHEGIRGISLSQHLNGNVAQFKDDNTGKWSLRAWLNKYRTLNDNGERLSLGSGTGTLITSGNLQNIDVCTPTHVIIMLGANGGGTLSQWQQMVNTIKSEFPDMIIGIAIPDAAGTYFPSLHPNCNYLCTIWNDTGSQGSRHNQQYNLQKMLQEYYGTEEQEQNNIFMLPFFFVAPTAESVALRTVPLPDAEYSITGNNKFYDHYGWHASTHVNGIGQTNWGYSLYSWLKYTMAKNLI